MYHYIAASHGNTIIYYEMLQIFVSAMTYYNLL